MSKNNGDGGRVWSRSKAALLHKIASQHVTGRTLLSAAPVMASATRQNLGIILSAWDEGGFSLNAGPGSSAATSNAASNAELAVSSDLASTTSTMTSIPTSVRGRDILSEFHSALDKLEELCGRAGLSPILSIKPDTLEYDAGRLAGLVHRAAPLGIRIHIDSLSPESVPQVFTMVDSMRDDVPRLLPSGAPSIGATVPSRWRRSEQDVLEWLDRGLAIRVVKGQWPDPVQKTDARERFLQLALAGAARVAGMPGTAGGVGAAGAAGGHRAGSGTVHTEPLIGLATHDRVLLKRILIDYGRRSGQDSEAKHHGQTHPAPMPTPNPFAIEQFFSLPLNGRRIAREFGLPYRLYIAYGHPALPYNTRFAFTRPGIALWVASSLFRPGKAAVFG